MSTALEKTITALFGREVAVAVLPVNGTQRLGLPPAAIPSAPDRSPVWPAGVTGSISHAAGLCAAVLSRDPTTKLGLDIEDPAPLDAELWPLVLTPAELNALEDHSADQRGRIAKQIFSIKEAAYKAQFPLTGAVIGFQALEVRPDFPSGAAQVSCTDIGAQVPGLAVLFPRTGKRCLTATPADGAGSLLLAACVLHH